MLTHSRISVLCLFLLSLVACRSKLELSHHSERAQYLECTHAEIPAILQDYSGFWRLESLDTTSGHNLLYLFSEARGERIIGVTEKKSCTGGQVVVGADYYFTFSCAISSNGNYSLYISKPVRAFSGHRFMFRVPLGSGDEYVSVGAQQPNLVLKVVNMEGLCYWPRQVD